MNAARYPSLFQLNTRVYLDALSRLLGRPATLDDVPGEELDAVAERGYDMVWLLGVWQTGDAARLVSAGTPAWREEFRRVLPDFRDGDVCGSCFAVRDYTVHADFGGDEALERLRGRLRERGLRLILDFVPNHVAPDHPWVGEHPEFFIEGSEEQLTSQPQNYRRIDDAGEGRILAYGRDPYFDGWPDTFQLNYANPALRAAMLGQLLRIAERCDGVRCDMAMLVLPDVFERTWGLRAEAFWPDATASVRAAHPGFLFMAEVYWDLEWTMMRQGFDYAYDKKLYDRLAGGDAAAVRAHLGAGLEYQEHLVRFLENHDEPRAAATFDPARHRAAAVVTYFSPGLRFFHQGQREGRRVRIPVHLRRGPEEEEDVALARFYDSLQHCLRHQLFRDGEWSLLEARRAWDDNASSEAYILFSWSMGGAERALVAVNFSGHDSQCYVSMPWDDIAGRTWRLRDMLGDATYDRDGSELAARGLYLAMPPWGCQVFDVRPAQAPALL